MLHLAQSDELAMASLADRFAEALAVGATGSSDGTTRPLGTVDDWAAASVAAQRDLAPEAIHQRWHQSASDLRRVFAEADPHRRVAWVAGEVSVTTLATTRLAESWVHAGDVADAVGVSLRPDERLRHVARLAWRTLPYAFSRADRSLAGPVAFHLRGPSGDPWDFEAGEGPVTVIRGEGLELCEVAAQRRDAVSTSLQGSGPDTAAVLELIRTYA